MAVYNTTFFDPAGEQNLAPGNEFVDHVFNPPNHIPGDHFVRVVAKFGQVFVPTPRHRTDLALSIDAPVTLCALVKPGQHLSDRVQGTLDRQAGGHHRPQPLLVAVTPHDDDRFGVPAAWIAEMGNAQVALRGQPTIQLEFPDTGALTLFRRAEVAEIRHHRLFRLERPVAGQHNHCGVGFAHIDERLICHRMGVTRAVVGR
ncbi:Uncharacterised protein [Mycobacterium tuberculosis]|nr:Uncharacterised protein [Mycobacterium tuberculosis]